MINTRIVNRIIGRTSSPLSRPCLGRTQRWEVETFSNYCNFNSTSWRFAHSRYFSITRHHFSKPGILRSIPTLYNNHSGISTLTHDNIIGLQYFIQLLKQKIPKGFEDFFPDGLQDKKSKAAEKENATFDKNENDGVQNPSEFHSKEESESKKQQRNTKSTPPVGDSDPGSLVGLAAVLLVIMILRAIFETEEVENGDEITFTEFRNRYLMTGAVEKLVVVNNRLVEVRLRNDYVETNSSIGASTPAGMITSSGVSMMDHPSETHEITKWSSSSSRYENGNPSTTTKDARRKKVPYFYLGSVENLEEKLTKAQLGLHPEAWIEVQYVTKDNVMLLILRWIPTIIWMGVIGYTMKGFMGGLTGAGGGGGRGAGGGLGGIFSVGKSTHKKIKPEDVNVTFADVAGCEQAKLEIMEFVDFLKDAKRFTKLGAKIPKGALFSGPPGTGKTLLARATAGEAGVPFYSISGSDFIEMFVGVGPSRVRDLFKEARANAPCIVFIDEIDAVGRKRGRGGFSGGNDERENTLNQLLVEMDGFSPTTGIVVLAGTNRVDILDQALRRPGRFDRQILVDKPDVQGRKEIFRVHLRGIKLAEDMDEYAGRLAGLTPGFTGADISNICNEAAIVAARRRAESVSMVDFEEAIDRIIGGLASNKIISPEERRIVAHHEAGHAIAGWFLEHADPLLKVTIIPRSSGALGFAQYLPKEVFLRSQDQIMDIVCMALAGRAAEQVMFGRVTTGSSDDLRRVTQLVYSMIKDFGMNDKVGQLAYADDENAFGGSERPYSDSVKEAMDDEARSIVNAAYERTIELITKHKEEVETVAKLLLEKETITHDDIFDLVGPRPFAQDKSYQEYISSRFSNKVSEGSTDKVDESSTDEQSANLTPVLA